MGISYGGRYDTVPGYVAASSLAASQYKIVKPATTAGQCSVGSAATDKIIGVLQNDPAAGEAAEIACGGVVKCLAEASVAAGDHVACSTTGRAKTTTTANNHVLGVAMQASGAAGDIIPVLIALGNY